MRIALSLLLLLLISTSNFAQKNTILFKDETGRSVQIDPLSLQRISVSVNGNDQKPHEYSGVLLSDLILAAGNMLGEGSKRQTITRFAVLKARDNYQCVFALAELDPLFSSSKIILADKIDGKPLSPAEGAFQVIVPSDLKKGRWIRQVVSIEIRTAL